MHRQRSRDVHENDPVNASVNARQRVRLQVCTQRARQLRMLPCIQLYTLVSRYQWQTSIATAAATVAAVLPN